MDRQKSTLIAVFSGLGTFIAMWYFAVLFHSKEPFFVASALMIAVVVHELGHLLVMELNGVKARIFFALIIGGAIPEEGYLQKFKDLKWFVWSEITLAGVTANLVSFIVALAIWQIGWLDTIHLKRFAEITGSIIFFNLIPWGPMDGGKFTQRLFDSVPEIRDRTYVAAISAAVLLMVAVLGFVSHKSPGIISYFIIFFGLRLKATKDDPEGSWNPKAMNSRQQFRAAAFYVGLLLAGGVLISTGARIV
jgi:Zn-dependent protease